MLVLSRRLNESILIGNDIRVTLCRIGPDQVRIGITAPDHVIISREEIRHAFSEGRRKAGRTVDGPVKPPA